MLREVTEKDRDIFIKFCSDFYNSDAVLHPIPHSHHEATFDEMMRSDTYLKGYIVTDGGRDAGYLLLSKSFSQEAGGIVIWVEEIYIEEGSRNHGLGGEIFDFIEKIPHARIRLEVERDNLAALRFYKRKGFRELDYMQMIKGL